MQQVITTALLLLSTISLSQYEMTTVGYKILKCETADVIIEEECEVIASNSTAVSTLYIDEQIKFVEISTQVTAMNGTWKLTDPYLMQDRNYLLFSGYISNTKKSYSFQVTGAGQSFSLMSSYPNKDGHLFLYKFLN
jgi:hypothetical protein